MKWGIRRYQPYGQGGYNPKDTGKYVGKRKLQRELNKTDQQRAQFQDSVTIARKKQEKYEAKGNVIKAEKWKKTGDDYEARLNEAKARTKELIRQADEQGFDVHSKQVRRDVRGGMRFISALAGGLVGATAATVIDAGANGKLGVEEGSKYKVKETKESQEMRKALNKASSYDFDGDTPKKEMGVISEGIKNAGKKVESSSVSSGKTDDGEKYSISEIKPDKDYDCLSGSAKVGDRKVEIYSFDDYCTPEMATKSASQVLSNFKSIEKEIQDYAVKDLFDDLALEGDSKSEFGKSIKIQSIHPDSWGGVEISCYTDSNTADYLWGHSYDVEYDLKKKRIVGASLNG